MTLRPILLFPDPILRQKTEEVSAFDESLARLVADLKETMYGAPGVGLAAPQIGFNINLAVIDTSAGEDPARKIILINPEILREEGIQRGPEGCLSIPGIHEVLERPRQVWLKNRRPDGTWYEQEGEDLLARAFCHEIDHLRGRLFVEYFGPVKRQVIQRKYQKLHK